MKKRFGTVLLALAMLISAFSFASYAFEETGEVTVVVLGNHGTVTVADAVSESLGIVWDEELDEDGNKTGTDTIAHINQGPFDETNLKAGYIVTADEGYYIDGVYCPEDDYDWNNALYGKYSAMWIPEEETYSAYLPQYDENGFLTKACITLLTFPGEHCYISFAEIPDGSRCVKTLERLKTALADSDVTNILIYGSFEINENINVTKTVQVITGCVSVAKDVTVSVSGPDVEFGASWPTTCDTNGNEDDAWSLLINNGTLIANEGAWLGQIRENNGEIIINKDSYMETCQINNDGATITVKDGGTFYSVQGSYVKNKGTVVIDEGGVLTTHMGQGFNNIGSLVINGTFNAGEYTLYGDENWDWDVGGFTDGGGTITGTGVFNNYMFNVDITEIPFDNFDGQAVSHCDPVSTFEGLKAAAQNDNPLIFLTGNITVTENITLTGKKVIQVSWFNDDQPYTLTLMPHTEITITDSTLNEVDLISDTVTGDTDISGGKPDIADALLLFKHVAGLQTITGACALLNADVDKNEDITIADALQLFKYVAGIITTL